MILAIDVLLTLFEKWKKGQEKKSCSGRSFISMVIFLLILVFAATGVYVVRERRKAAACKHNLQEIYTVLELHEMQYGSLPVLAFFPEDPLKDQDSLRVFLEKCGANPDISICPSSPRVVRRTGLSYLWNVDLNGQKLAGSGEPVWMLVEISALSDQVPPPHHGRYHILFTNGRIVESRQRPKACATIEL